MDLGLPQSWESSCPAFLPFLRGEYHPLPLPISCCCCTSICQCGRINSVLHHFCSGLKCPLDTADHAKKLLPLIPVATVQSECTWDSIPTAQGLRCSQLQAIVDERWATMLACRKCWAFCILQAVSNVAILCKPGL